MKKKIKDLTIQELNKKFCKKYLLERFNSCMNCPLLLNNDKCYRDVCFAKQMLNENKEKIKELDNKEIGL